MLALSVAITNQVLEIPLSPVTTAMLVMCVNVLLVLINKVDIFDQVRIVGMFTDA